MNVQSVFLSDPTGQELVAFAKTTAERLVRDGLTRSQIRTIFTEVRRIEALWEINKSDALRRLNMLKPKLDYQSERYREVGHLREVLGQAIEQVSSAGEDDRDDRFQRFMDLFEAILAYHRAQGGRK